MASTQSSLEYLMIIAISLGIILPIAYLFYKHSTESNAQLFGSQIDQIGRNIVDTAENVYFSGEGSKATLEINLPENVNIIYIIENRELVFNTTTTIGESQSVFFSSVNITSDDASEECIMNGNCKLILESGFSKIQFLSINNGKQVLISKFEE